MASHLIILSHKLSGIPRREPSSGKFNSFPKPFTGSTKPSPHHTSLSLKKLKRKKVQQVPDAYLVLKDGLTGGGSGPFSNPPSHLSLSGTQGSCLSLLGQVKAGGVGVGMWQSQSLQSWRARALVEAQRGGGCRAAGRVRSRPPSLSSPLTQHSNQLIIRTKKTHP